MPNAQKPPCWVITGVSRGLGRAMALKLAASGHTVCGCARSDAHVAELARELGPPHHFAVVDIRSDDAVRRWAETVLASYRVEWLLNVAALINHNAPLWEISADEIAAVLDTNLKGTVNMIRHFVPAMLEQRSGVIVNFSSGWGRSVSPEVAPYCCTKWGIEGLTQALAAELPPPLAAVALNPGIINTDMLRSCFADAAAHYPTPEAWAQRAVPHILRLSRKDNGASASVPGF